MLGLEDYRTPNVKNTHSLAKKIQKDFFGLDRTLQTNYIVLCFLKEHN